MATRSQRSDPAVKRCMWPACESPKDVSIVASGNVCKTYCNIHREMVLIVLHSFGFPYSARPVK
jgi:hypothetical protein